MSFLNLGASHTCGCSCFFCLTFLSSACADFALGGIKASYLCTCQNLVKMSKHGVPKEALASTHIAAHPEISVSNATASSWGETCEGSSPLGRTRGVPRAPGTRCLRSPWSRGWEHGEAAVTRVPLQKSLGASSPKARGWLLA